MQVIEVLRSHLAISIFSANSIWFSTSIGGVSSIARFSKSRIIIENGILWDEELCVFLFRLRFHMVEIGRGVLFSIIKKNGLFSVNESFFTLCHHNHKVIHSTKFNQMVTLTHRSITSPKNMRSLFVSKSTIFYTSATVQAQFVGNTNTCGSMCCRIFCTVQQMVACSLFSEYSKCKHCLV